MKDFQIGSTYSGFLLQRREYIDEIDSTVLLFTHELLGTPALSIKNEDPNKTFCIAFNTLPDDSTGVAHILEHSVLMGSKKYPVKDVFGEIHKGGLMTFLNAMTGSDTTYYPFATLNNKEYFNIMDVYCDVTLNPLLDQTTFEQEGWHFHKESPDEPMELQGVVYNEMKGAFSDPIRAIFHHAFSGLFPGSTYAHESGGDPQNIPDLTFDQFVAFHERFYHPTNSALFFYGNGDLEEELSFVQERFLQHFPSPGTLGAIVHGRTITRPQRIEDTYTIQSGSNPAGKTYLAVASSVGTVLDREDNTAFQVIAQILYNSDASPLKKAIIDAGLCKDFGGLYLSTSSFRTVMMTYLVGSEPENSEKFASVYDAALREMVQSGLDSELVLSELNKYEFSVRESLTRAQRGLDLIGKAQLALKHNADPFEFLRIDDLFKEIRRKALEENYFEGLIQRALLDNPATVEIILKPDPDKSARSDQEESKRIADFEQNLDENGLQDVIQRSRELMELQNTFNDEETLHLLPQLKISDLNPAPDFHQVEPESLQGIPFLISSLPTNSICYIDFGFDGSVIPTELLPLLSLFATIVTEVGTETKDYMRVARELGTYTGGFDSSFNTYSRLGNSGACSPMLWFHLKALNTFLDPALSLVSEIFSQASFADRRRIREIVLREFAWAEHSAHSEGYSLASSRVFSHLSTAGQYNEYVNGATAYLALKDLANNYDQQEEQFLASLEQLRQLLFRRQGLTVAITAEPEGIHSFRDRSAAVIDSLRDQEKEVLVPQFQQFERFEGLCTSAEVVYNVQGCSLFTDSAQYNGHFEVLRTWISRDYLWNTVRQMGGAYGCFVQFNHITGNIGFVSYRDPHVAKTFSAYDYLPAHLDRLTLSRQVLDQLIIGTYGGLVPHQSPAAKGAAARNDYLSGITPEFKLQRINEVLGTSLASLKSFTPFFENLRGNCYRATIGNSKKIRAAAKYFTDIVEI
ncbi:MAG: insulinase family protein [Desulfobulbaceae bacterium]|nr:insulinase family protein [Desulfobulbaceae bacterium]